MPNLGQEKYPPTKMELERLREIERNYETQKHRESLEPYMQDFMRQLEIVLTNTPLADWPELATRALNITSKRFPWQVRRYISQLSE